MSADDLSRMERWMGEHLSHPFRRRELLETAFTHRSYANETPGVKESNQRLEFLGDAVLGLVVSQYCYERFPDWPEGDLSKVRAAVVCAPALARSARTLAIGEVLRLGRGEASTGGRDRDSNLADAFEAVVGALYLDGGLEAARPFVLQALMSELAAVQDGQRATDYKTQLQEHLQRFSAESPTYRLVAEEGPDHAKTFTMAVYWGGRVLGRGAGHSKKEAEQEAARQALAALLPPSGVAGGGT